jgi:GNAT superfamily N-acetyltransferase
MDGSDPRAIDTLDADSVEAAAALVAREHATARARRPSLPVDGEDPDRCLRALEALLAEGGRGLVARRAGRCVGILCGRVVGPGLAVLPAHGVAVDPAEDDPTRVLVGLYAQLAPWLVDSGARYHHATHVDHAPLADAFANLGFGRTAVYATQPARRREREVGVEVRIADGDDLDVIADLSQVEMAHRFTAPVYSPQPSRSRDEVREHHRQLLDRGAVHLVARVGAEDVGLLTLELDYSAPRLCPEGQPFIGATATVASARGRGVAGALVEAALDWADRHGFHSVSVDFMPANPLSRPFWLGAGFRCTGYAVARTIPPSYGPEARSSPGSVPSMLS